MASSNEGAWFDKGVGVGVGVVVKVMLLLGES